MQYAMLQMSEQIARAVAAAALRCIANSRQMQYVICNMQCYKCQMSEQIARAVAVAAAAEPTAQSNRIEQMFGAVMAAAGTALSPQSILSITTYHRTRGWWFPVSWL
jgi:hypothetical protein